MVDPIRSNAILVALDASPAAAPRFEGEGEAEYRLRVAADRVHKKHLGQLQKELEALALAQPEGRIKFSEFVAITSSAPGQLTMHMAGPAAQVMNNPQAQQQMAIAAHQAVQQVAPGGAVTVGHAYDAELDGNVLIFNLIEPEAEEQAAEQPAGENQMPQRFPGEEGFNARNAHNTSSVGQPFYNRPSAPIFNQYSTIQPVPNIKRVDLNFMFMKSPALLPLVVEALVREIKEMQMDAFILNTVRAGVQRYINATVDDQYDNGLDQLHNMMRPFR